jgi:hypothetical protein
VNLEDGFRDLAPLDPAVDPLRWERMVAGITAAAAPELRRRSVLPPAGMLALLGGWVRPAAGIAAALTAAAGLFLASTPPAPRAAEAEPGTTGEIVAWMESGTPPSVEELAALLETAP